MRLTKRDFVFSSHYVATRLQSWSIAECLRKLQNYENAEEDGRLLILPFALGAPVFTITFDNCWGGKCCWLVDGKCSKGKSSEYCPQEVIPQHYSLYLYKNKIRAFATCAEAEAAIAKCKENV